MMNLMVDNIENARLNRERVSKGYGNKGYVTSWTHASGNRGLGPGTAPFPHVGISGSLPVHWKWRRQRDEDFSDIGGWQTEE